MRFMILLLSLTWLTAEDSRPAPDRGSGVAIVRTGKQATALVVMPNESMFGSAFCIHKDGYFLTNHHVAEGHSECEIVVNPGEPNQQKLHAKVIRSSESSDLALLKVEGAPELTVLAVDGDAALNETDQVMAFGYPFGTALAVRNDEFPAVSVLVGRITAVRKNEGRAEAIQLDAQLNPGNSGGPVLNSNGKVIGVVRSGIRGTGLNFAIPSHKIQTFLDDVDVQLSCPESVAENESVRFAVTIDSPMKTLSKPEVAVDVKCSRYDQRSFKLKRGTGTTFEATIVPVVTPAELPYLGVDAEFTNGSLKCRLVNGTVRTEAGEIPMADLSSIESKPGAFVITKTDQTAITSKTVTGLPSSLRLGSADVEIDLHDAIRLNFTSGALAAVEVTVRVSDAGMPVVSKVFSVRTPGRTEEDVPSAQESPPKATIGTEFPPGFEKLGESRSLPEYLVTADALERTDDGGVRFAAMNARNNEPAGVIQTRARDFLERNFVFDVLLKFEKGDRIAYVGLGAGRADQSYNGLTDSIYLRFHAPTLADGMVDIQNWRFGHTNFKGKVPNFGINRVRITKEGNSVSFHVDPENDGPTDDDLELTIPDIREFSPFLNSKNTNLFLAGSGTFLATRIAVDPEKSR